jgi:hypothetical protein
LDRHNSEKLNGPFTHAVQPECNKVNHKNLRIRPHDDPHTAAQRTPSDHCHGHMIDKQPKATVGEFSPPSTHTHTRSSTHTMNGRGDDGVEVPLRAKNSNFPFHPMDETCVRDSHVLATLSASQRPRSASVTSVSLV